MLSVRELDLPRPGGGVLHAYDTGPTGRPGELTVFWHGGTPNTGLPPAPLFAAAERLGIRFVGADRPGYGGTTRDPSASVGSVAADVEAVADRLGIERLATLGHSGGGPRALATAALLPDRVVAAAVIAPPAPSHAAGLDRSAGMAAGPAREQAAAALGRDALLRALEDDFDDDAFTLADRDALASDWSWFLPVVQAATATGPDGQADDLLAQARPWGFDLASVSVPALVVHGAEDRLVPAAHGRWLARRIPAAELRIAQGAGHIAVLREGDAVLARLRERA